MPVDEIGNHAGQFDSLLWIELKSPKPELVERLADDLGLGDKTKDELVAPHRRTKIIGFSKAVLVVAITVEIEGQKAVFGET